MPPYQPPSKRARWIKTAIYGLFSGALYVALYRFENNILELAGQGGWAFLVPVAVALVFSIIHGAFTSGFWDSIGVQAKK